MTKKPKSPRSGSTPGLPEKAKSGKAKAPRPGLKEAWARIQQLQQEIVTRKKENEEMAVENQRQNEILRALNQELDQKVKERTQELEASRDQFESQNQSLQELSESKEAMMHMIVHDMKNPLTSVMGTLCLLQNKSIPLADNLRQVVLDAHIQAIKLRCMIDDILTISRMKSNEFKIEAISADLIGLIQQSMLVMETIKGERKVTFRFEPQTPELMVMMDFQVTERIINNLINNALKYAPEDSEILLAVTVEEDFAKVSVTNWGVSIPANYHQRIFDLFCRVKPNDTKISGTGLGLAFCKLAVEAHGGSIGVVSPVPPADQGARFSFTLPLALPGNNNPSPLA